METSANIGAAQSLFHQELVTLCSASANAGQSPELQAAYTFLLASESAIWSLYADKGLVKARLQYLYACRHALDALMRAVALDVTAGEAGVTESLSDEAKHFADARAAVDGDIKTLEGQVSATFGAAIGQMTTSVPAVLAPPRLAPNGGLSPTDPLYRDLPGFGRLRRWW